MPNKPKSAHRDGWGILNRYGDMWSSNVFSTKEQAESYLRDFWRGNENAPDLTSYRIIWCRQRTVPIREPEAKKARDGR